MKYYHVLFKLKNQNEEPWKLFSDLSKDILTKHFVKPFNKGKNIYYKNEIINISEIEKIHICESDLTEDEVREKLNREGLERLDRLNRESDSITVIGTGGGYRTEDILEGATEITNDYIKGLSGSSWLILIKNFLYNPWIIAIVGGLIVAKVSVWLLK